MEVGLKIITSDMARDMILSDAKARKEDPNIPPNRSMSNTVADNYARDMANGNWHPSWDAITISKNGVVKNGQHRLKAILKSGVSCPFLVITDAPNDFCRREIAKPPVWKENLLWFLFSRSVMSGSLRPHGLQHATLPCPLPSPGAC